MDACLHLALDSKYEISLGKDWPCPMPVHIRHNLFRPFVAKINLEEEEEEEENKTGSLQM